MYVLKGHCHVFYWLFQKSSHNHVVRYEFYGVQTSSEGATEEQSHQKNDYAWAFSGLPPALQLSCCDVTEGSLFV